MRTLRFAFAAGLGLVAASLPASAGLDKLHKQQLEGGKVCFVSHWHYKSSGAWPTRGEAEAAAARAWGRFTAGEYGAAWGDVRLAAGMQMDCAQATSHRGPSWSCNLKARPCRR